MIMKPLKILFADDDLKYSLLLKRFLEQEGYEVTYVGNGRMAVEQFPLVRPDLVLLDINMPRLDGFGVLEVMKQRNWLQEIPVIITSSEDDESFIQKAYELGVTDHIRRPFNLTVTQRRR